MRESQLRDKKRPSLRFLRAEQLDAKIEGRCLTFKARDLVVYVQNAEVVLEWIWHIAVFDPDVRKPFNG